MQPIGSQGARTLTKSHARLFFTDFAQMTCAILQSIALLVCLLALLMLVIPFIADMFVYAQKDSQLEYQRGNAQFDSAALLRELDRHEIGIAEVKRDLAEYRITSEARTSRLEERFATLEWVAKGIAAGVGGLVLMELGKAWGRMQRRRNGKTEE